MQHPEDPPDGPQDLPEHQPGQYGDADHVDERGVEPLGQQRLSEYGEQYVPDEDDGAEGIRLDLFTAIQEETPTDPTEDPTEDPDYYRGLAAREEFRRAILDVMAAHGLDALLYPNSQVLPPTRKELDDWKWTVLTFPMNALIAAQSDLPSIALLASWTAESP